MLLLIIASLSVILITSCVVYYFYVIKPKKISNEPSTTSTQPSTTLTQPSTTSTQPSTTLTQPSTTSTQPSSTSTNNNQPTFEISTQPTEKPPVNCIVSDWSIPSDNNCTPKDGKFYKTRTRTIIQQPSNNGTLCPPTSEDILCNPINCSVSDWTTPSDNTCSLKNGKYYKTRTRSVTQNSSLGGEECPPTSEDILCNPVNCSVSDWTTPSDDKCFRKDDNKYYKTRTRSVTQSDSFGGSSCPPLSEDILCNPINCSVSDWSSPSDDKCFIKPDGKFYKTRTRSITQSDSFGGSSCPPLSEDILCNPVNCSVSDWTTPSDDTCSLKNGKFYKTRTRSVTQSDSFGGSKCPPLSEDILCNPVNCSVSDWNTPSDDSCFAKSDGNIYKTRTRTVTQQKSNGGSSCPPLSEDIICNTNINCFNDLCGDPASQLTFCKNIKTSNDQQDLISVQSCGVYKKITPENYKKAQDYFAKKGLSLPDMANIDCFAQNAFCKNPADYLSFCKAALNKPSLDSQDLENVKVNCGLFNQTSPEEYKRAQDYFAKKGLSLPDLPSVNCLESTRESWCKDPVAYLKGCKVYPFQAAKYTDEQDRNNVQICMTDGLISKDSYDKAKLYFATKNLTLPEFIENSCSKCTTFDNFCHNLTDCINCSTIQNQNIPDASALNGVFDCATRYPEVAPEILKNWNSYATKYPTYFTDDKYKYVYASANRPSDCTLQFNNPDFSQCKWDVPYYSQSIKQKSIDWLKTNTNIKIINDTPIPNDPDEVQELLKNGWSFNLYQTGTIIQPAKNGGQCNDTKYINCTLPMFNPVPEGYSQGDCPIGYYDSTKGKTNKWSCAENCPGKLSDNSCYCACVKNSIKPVDVNSKPPPGFSQGSCNPGYYDVTRGKFNIWNCGDKCLGGKNLTDNSCNCACVPNYQPPPIIPPKNCSIEWPEIITKENGTYEGCEPDENGKFILVQTGTITSPAENGGNCQDVRTLDCPPSHCIVRYNDLTPNRFGWVQTWDGNQCLLDKNDGKWKIKTTGYIEQEGNDGKECITEKIIECPSPPADKPCVTDDDDSQIENDPETGTWKGCQWNPKKNYYTLDIPKKIVVPSTDGSICDLTPTTQYPCPTPTSPPKCVVTWPELKKDGKGSYEGCEWYEPWGGYRMIQTGSATSTPFGGLCTNYPDQEYLPEISPGVSGGMAIGDKFEKDVPTRIIMCPPRNCDVKWPEPVLDTTRLQGTWVGCSKQPDGKWRLTQTGIATTDGHCFPGNTIRTLECPIPNIERFNFTMDKSSLFTKFIKLLNFIFILSLLILGILITKKYIFSRNN